MSSPSTAPANVNPRTVVELNSWCRICSFCALLIGVASLSACVAPPRQLPAQVKVARHEGKPPPGGTQKWNPLWWFGNADDPVPPQWYRPGQLGRVTLWQLRNPLHNFTFYIIGVADKDFIRYGREPEAVFATAGGWNWAVIQHGWLRLPFVSYRGEVIRFYALWRERGNFGLKLNAEGRKELNSENPKTTAGRRRVRVTRDIGWGARR